MKKWAFVDCFQGINFENIDFDGYEKIVLFTSDDSLSVGDDTGSKSDVTVIDTESATQQQMSIALAYHVSQFDASAAPKILFDIYSNDIESPSLDDCLRKADRHCQLHTLPPNEKITLSKAVDNFIHHLGSKYTDKRNRPRSISIYLKLLECEWRFLRGRIKAEELLKEADRLGLIRRASNGIYFKF